jgi:hypothetical protein
VSRSADRPTALVVMAPVKQARDEDLLVTLSAIPTGRDSPFASVESTHFARWLLIGALLGGDGEPVEPDQAYLIFTADFDGSVEGWVATVLDRVGPTVDRVFEHCQGYPGSADRSAFLDFIGEHRVDAGFSVISYRATVGAIRESLALRRALREFAASSQGLAPEALRSAWQERFGR